MAGINRPNTPPKKPTVQAPQKQQGLPLKPVKESVDPNRRKGRNK